MRRAQAACAAGLVSTNALVWIALLWSLLPTLLAPFLAPLVRAYTDETVPINVRAVCLSDGQCQPELYVVREDPAQPATVQVNYTPSVDPMRWTITLRNVRNLTVDARSNYETRGCATFFADCPETDYLRWLSNREVLTIVLDLDTTLRFRLLHVFRPTHATLDGYPYSHWSWDGDGITAHSIVAGVRTLRIETRPTGGHPFDADPAPLLFLVIALSLISITAYAMRSRI